MINYYKIQVNNINYHVYYAINSQNNFWEYKENIHVLIIYDHKMKIK